MFFFPFINKYFPQLGEIIQGETIFRTRRKWMIADSASHRALFIVFFYFKYSIYAVLPPLQTFRKQANVFGTSTVSMFLLLFAYAVSSRLPYRCFPRKIFFCIFLCRRGVFFATLFPMRETRPTPNTRFTL